MVARIAPETSHTAIAAPIVIQKTCWSVSTFRTVSSTAFDHYALLKTTEELLGLPLLAHAADPGTASMRAAFGL